MSDAATGEVAVFVAILTAYTARRLAALLLANRVAMSRLRVRASGRSGRDRVDKSGQDAAGPPSSTNNSDLAALLIATTAGWINLRSTEIA